MTDSPLSADDHVLRRYLKEALQLRPAAREYASHPEPDLLGRYLKGELPGDQAQDLRGHLFYCNEGCHETLVRLEQPAPRRS